MKIEVLLIWNISLAMLLLFERLTEGSGNGYHDNPQNSYRRSLDDIKKGKSLPFTNLSWQHMFHGRDAEAI
jgi:hypothetical protein